MVNRGPLPGAMLMRSPDENPVAAGAALHTLAKALFTAIAVVMWIAHLATGKPSITTFIITTALFVFIAALFEPRKPAPDKED